jgi:nucleoside-diphosphate-sugar epimerase
MNALQAATLRNWVDAHAAQQPISWRGLQGARLLLTGCTGPFGLWILHRISHACARGELEVEEIVVLSRSSSRVDALLKHLHSACHARGLVADIRDLQLGQFSPTHVIHGATTTAAETFEGAKPEEKFHVLVDGTRSLINTLEKRPPTSMVFLSSGITYGSRLESGASEVSRHAPLTIDVEAALGHAKRAAEFLLSSACRRWDVQLWIARCFSFCGPGMPLNLHYALGDFIRQAMHSDKIIISGNAKTTRSYLHLADMAHSVLSLLNQTTLIKDQKIVNIGSDRALTLQEVAQIVANEINTKAQIKTNDIKLKNKSGNSNSFYVPNIKKISKIIGPSTMISIETAIKQTEEFERLSKT